MARTARAAAVAAAAALTLAGSLLAGTASADAGPPGALISCNGLRNLQDPTVATNVRTVAQTTLAGTTAQVRAGYVNGVQYGWGRGLSAPSGYWITFEIDINGDRDADCATWTALGGAVSWTTGTQTSPSSIVAFRACVQGPENYGCSAGAQGIETPWW